MARGRPSKKQLILDTARTLFAETGYQGTSIDLVVKKAGVSKPTVYNNFPTKQALLFALMEALLAEFKRYRETLWNDAELSPEQAIVKVYQQVANTPEFLAVYRISYGESHKLEADTYQLFKQFDRDLVESYQQWLKDQKLAVSDANFLSIIAICREGILIPALSGSTLVKPALLQQALTAQFKK